jgi:hypothetical protein
VWLEHTDYSSWAKVSSRTGTPLNAQLCVGTIIALLGCIYLGSTTAFNAMMSSAVYVVLTLTYFHVQRYSNRPQDNQQLRIPGAYSHERRPRPKDYAAWTVRFELCRRDGGQYCHGALASVCHCLFFVPVLYAT